MAELENSGGTYSYNAAGTNTLTQVAAFSTIAYILNVTNTGGSVGYLQVYNNASADANAGTPTFTYAVAGGTTSREVDFGPYGRRLDGGLSYLWAVGATGTVAHGANANVDITLSQIK